MINSFKFKYPSALLMALSLNFGAPSSSTAEALDPMFFANLRTLCQNAAVTALNSMTTASNSGATPAIRTAAQNSLNAANQARTAMMAAEQATTNARILAQAQKVYGNFSAAAKQGKFVADAIPQLEAAAANARLIRGGLRGIIAGEIAYVMYLSLQIELANKETKLAQEQSDETSMEIYLGQIPEELTDLRDRLAVAQAQLARDNEQYNKDLQNNCGDVGIYGYYNSFFNWRTWGG